MHFQNGRILKEMYRFYGFWGAFAPHHGLRRVKKAVMHLRCAYSLDAIKMD